MTANIAGKFDIMLKDNTKELGQVVVTGYGKTTKDRVTGSVGIVTAKDLKGSPTANIDQLLQGKLPVSAYKPFQVVRENLLRSAYAEQSH